MGLWQLKGHWLLQRVDRKPLEVGFFLSFFFFKEFIYLVLQREEGGREGEKHPLVASCTSPAGDLAGNPSICLD